MLLGINIKSLLFKMFPAFVWTHLILIHLFSLKSTERNGLDRTGPDWPGPDRTHSLPFTLSLNHPHPSFIHSLTNPHLLTLKHSSTHSINQSHPLSHSPTSTNSHLLTLKHSLNQLTHSRNRSINSLTPSLTHTHIHPFTHSLIHQLNHSLTC